MILPDEDQRKLARIEARRITTGAHCLQIGAECACCPGCGLPTLNARSGGYEICQICNWEDDSQDDSYCESCRQEH